MEITQYSIKICHLCGAGRGYVCKLEVHYAMHTLTDMQYVNSSSSS